MTATIRWGRAEARWTTIGSLTRELARRHGSRDAVTFDGHPPLTYEEVDDRSDRVAAAFAEAGIGRGERVASLLYNSTEQLLVWLAAAKVGAVAVPINVSVRQDDLAHVLRESRPRGLVCGGDLTEAYLAVRDIAQDVSVDLEVVVGGTDAPPTGFVPFGDVETRGARPPAVEVDPSEPSCILFTGGTTGLPKGVVRSHFSYLCAAERYGQVFRPRPGDRHLSSTHLFHCGGQEIGFLGPFVHGVPTVLPAWFSVRHYWGRVREVGATIIEVLPSMISVLLAREPAPDDADNPVRVGMGATVSSAPGARREFERRFGLELLEVYAMTETGTLLISNHEGDTREGSVGRARDWCEIAILGEEDQRLPPGVTGEIALRPTLPYSMASGYYGRPEATVDHWRNLWLHTGDVGRLDEDGWLYFVGRQAHWIRRRGENVSVVEVEQALDRHPDVAESAVVGVEADLGEQDVKAFVVRNPGATLAAEALLEWCRQRLAYFKVPTTVEFVGALPRTATKGDIERHKLK